MKWVPAPLPLVADCPEELLAVGDVVGIFDAFWGNAVDDAEDPAALIVLSRPTIDRNSSAKEAEIILGLLYAKTIHVFTLRRSW